MKEPNIIDFVASFQLLPTNRLPDLNLWVCSGETLSKKLAEKFYTVFNPATHKLCNFYGSTEVMGDISYHIVQPEELHKMDKVPIGMCNCGGGGLNLK